MSACQTEITNYLEDFLSDGDAYDAVEILTDIIRGFSSVLDFGMV